MLFRENNQILSRSSSTKLDEGFYFCSAVNAHGRDTSIEIKVTINGKSKQKNLTSEKKLCQIKDNLLLSNKSRSTVCVYCLFLYKKYFIKNTLNIYE